MRLRLRGLLQIEIWADVATDASCGESRADWRLVAVVSAGRLARALENLLLRKSSEEWV